MDFIPAKLHNFKDGDVAILEKEQTTLTFKDGVWGQPEKATFSIALDDLNKQILKSFPDITNLNSVHKDITDFYFLYKNHSIFLLVNYELKYCTILQYQENEKETFSEAVIGCLSYLGKLKSCNSTSKTFIEFWVEQKNEINKYLLIPYEAGVVKYG